MPLLAQTDYRDLCVCQLCQIWLIPFLDQSYFGQIWHILVLAQSNSANHDTLYFRSNLTQSSFDHFCHNPSMARLNFFSVSPS